MRIAQVDAQDDFTLHIKTVDGKEGRFDVRPYLQFEAFEKLSDAEEFAKVTNGGYYVEWACGADLSVDTIEAKMVALV